MFRPHLKGSATYKSMTERYNLLTPGALFWQVKFSCMLVNCSVTKILSTPTITEPPSVKCQESFNSSQINTCVVEIGVLGPLFIVSSEGDSNPAPPSCKISAGPLGHGYIVTCLVQSRLIQKIKTDGLKTILKKRFDSFFGNVSEYIMHTITPLFFFWVYIANFWIMNLNSLIHSGYANIAKICLVGFKIYHSTT